MCLYLIIILNVFSVDYFDSDSEWQFSANEDETLPKNHICLTSVKCCTGRWVEEGIRRNCWFLGFISLFCDGIESMFPWSWPAYKEHAGVKDLRNICFCLCGVKCLTDCVLMLDICSLCYASSRPTSAFKLYVN